MRIRSTKPEFWRSRRIASVDWDARLVLKGLESYVDDNGVGKDDIALIVGDLFSRDMLANPRDTLARVSEAISELFEAGLLHRYEDDGTELLFVSFWESIQRIDKPGKGRLPRPDGTFQYGESIIGAPSREDSRESREPSRLEQGNRGTGEQSLSSTVADATPDMSEDFDAFWEPYPRKEGKGAARKALKAALKKTDLDTILAGLSAYTTRVSRDGTERRFIKTPAAWLNGEHWDDDHSPPSGPARDPDAWMNPAAQGGPKW